MNRNHQLTTVTKTKMFCAVIQCLHEDTKAYDIALNHTGVITSHLTKWTLIQLVFSVL